MAKQKKIEKNIDYLHDELLLPMLLTIEKNKN